MARLKFDENYHVEDFTFVLSTQGKKHLGAIGNIEPKSVRYKRNLNSANEVSFDVYKELNYRQERLWDDIDDLKLIWIKDTNEYFSIEVQLDDSDSLKKSITATSLGEVETSQTIIYGLEINNEDDIARDDYVITKFYDSENPEGSLLHRVLSFMPHYSIKHVDSSLKDLQRSFSVDGTSVYDFFTGECAEQFNCIFIIDSANRTISAYDLYTVCRDCGYRGEFNDVCPECGSTNLKYFGDDTTIFVDRENLAESITFTTDVDSIKNCFKLEAGDDNMTAAVINCNPNGTDRIYCISPEQRKDMSDELIKKLDLYDELYNYYTKDYQDIMSGIYECIDKILYYTSEMMPTIDIDETSSAADQAAKLTIANLSPTALSKLSSSTSVATVNSALKNYASIYIKTGYFKVEINQSSFTYKGTEGSHHYGNWTGSFKVTNYSDEEDVAITPTMVIKITDDYETFLNQKIEKSIKSNDTDDGSVFDVLSISNQSKFESALTLYCLNRLTSFYDAIQGVIDIMIEQNQASSNSDLYNSLYLPYYNKLVACQKEIDKRQATINEWERKQENLQKQKNVIQDALNFKDFLGDELYLEFCVYKREDKYSNSNYISDGLDNAEIFENAKEFFETAKKELVKASTHQHSISANLYNLLAMKEFEPLVDNFEVGNWIRIGLDGKVYRLRLVSYEISFSDIQNINVEFSDLIMVDGVASDIESILKSAQSMASSYGYVSKQAEKGNSANGNINKWLEDGLNSALVQIKNNDKEEITYDKHGILCRSYDDITDSYSDEQLIITHNILGFTDDGLKTVKTALGKHDYTYYNGSAFVKGTGYGLSSDFVQAGHVTGSQIIGGDIYSSNYSPTTGTHIDLNNGQFSFGGGALKWDGTTLTISSPSIPSKVSQLTNDSNFQNAIQVTQITKDTVTAPFIQTLNLTVGNEIKMGSNATITWSQVTGTDNIATKNYVTSQGYETASSIKSTVITKDYIESLEIRAGSVDAEKITGTTIKGKTFSGGSITIGNNFKVDTEGNMTAKNATITGSINGSSITGSTFNNNNGTFKVESDGALTAGNVNITGGKIGGLKIYVGATGSNYLETIPSSSGGRTAGIGNNETWSLWAGWNGSEATFWVTENGEVHMRNWLYGQNNNVWATWTKSDWNNRYGVNYILGDWDSVNKKMYVKIIFYDHSKTPASVGYVVLPALDWHDGEP